MKRLAIITTHPIQYNAPLFKLLAEQDKFSIMVFYTWGQQVMEHKFDPGFAKAIQWDIDLLEGYPYTFVNNIAKQPGSQHYNGINNPTLIYELQVWKPNAILIFGWNFKSHLKVLRFFHNKIPIFFRGDSTLLDKQNGVKEFCKKKILNWVYRHVDKAIYVGQENRKYYKYAGFQDDQLVLAPHAIDNTRFCFDEQARNKIRSSLNIPQTAIVFLFAGKLEPKKDPALLLNAFVQLKKNNAHLLIAGNGVLESSLKNEFEENPNIHFLPFQNQTQMPGLYSACDIFVLPSKGPGETWGLSVNEAMACSRPVLVSNKCGCAYDLLQDGQNGFIFKSGDQKDLLKKMEYFLDNRAQLAPMGNTSFKIVNEFTYQRICDSLENLMNNTF
ncbi:MAG: glycosyltransferase family 4 protein [Niastella sp.]|nr:glycosyltransferase family 4 protein [Niastella sp.]